MVYGSSLVIVVFVGALGLLGVVLGPVKIKSLGSVGHAGLAPARLPASNIELSFGSGIVSFVWISVALLGWLLTPSSMDISVLVSRGDFNTSVFRPIHLNSEPLS